MPPTQQFENQQRQLKRKAAPPPPAVVPPPAAAVVEDGEALQRVFHEPPLPPLPPHLQELAQHYSSVYQATTEARERLHAKLDEVLHDGRYSLKSALRDLEGLVSEAKHAVDLQLQRSLEQAQREALQARRAAIKADALAQKLAFIRGRVEGT